MTDFSELLVVDRGQQARQIHLVDKTNFLAWVKKRSEDRALLETHRFDGKNGFAFVILPRGADFEVVSAVKNSAELSRWCAKLAESLPEGTYKLADREPAKAVLGWLLGQYSFEHYRSKMEQPERGQRLLVTSDAAKVDAAVRLAEATALVRDLFNPPASDLGPADRSFRLASKYH
jgi:leucyl aminopeptidase